MTSRYYVNDLTADKQRLLATKFIEKAIAKMNEAKSGIIEIWDAEQQKVMFSRNVRRGDNQ